VAKFYNEHLLIYLLLHIKRSHIIIKDTRGKSICWYFMLL